MMDAQHLGFQDGVFDVVVAQYVITAVPDPEATLDEFARVIKPGGEIVLVNHLGAESRPARVVRTMVRAAGAPARLAAGIPLGAPGRMGGAPRRRARRRAARRCRRSGIFRSSALRGSTPSRASDFAPAAGRSAEPRRLKRIGADAIGISGQSDYLPLESALNYPKSRPGQLDMDVTAE